MDKKRENTMDFAANIEKVREVMIEFIKRVWNLLITN